SEHHQKNRRRQAEVKMHFEDQFSQSRSYRSVGRTAFSLPFRKRSNQYICQFRLSTRCRGSPVRVRLWFSRGKITSSVVTPKCLSARYHCSPCSRGTRRSLSECSTSVGVFTFAAYFRGDMFQ